MKVDRFDEHTAVGHEKRGYRRVDAARKQYEPFAVRTQGQTAESRNFLLVHVGKAAPHIRVQSHIRVVTGWKTAYQHA